MRRTHARPTYAQQCVRYFEGPLLERLASGDTDRWRRPTVRWRRLQLHPLEPRATVSFEQKELHAARYGLDLRHPFADRDLIDFLISLPCALKIDPFRPKALLREALADVLPPLVRDRKTKSNYLSVVHHRADPAWCVDRVRGSGVRLPHIAYQRLFDDATSDPGSLPPFFLVNLARLHTFAAHGREVAAA